MALQFNQIGGNDGGSGEKQTLISPLNTINVTETETGHEIDVDNTIIETINNKQDKMIVGNFQTNAILSLSLLERNDSAGAIQNRVIGNYVPLIEIQCVNNGKSQFEFSVFSREDSMNYYGRYLLTTWNGSNPNCKFELLDYCNDNNNNVFNATNIVAIKLNPKESNQLARYLICKKIISTSGALDAYFVNILSQDLGFCYSKKYYTRSPQVYYNPLEVIQISQSVTRWNWYFNYNFNNWNNFPGEKGLIKEEEYKNNPIYAQTADLTNTDTSTDDYVVYYYPTPSIIKPLTINGTQFTGVEPRSINTEDWFADGVVGENADGYHDLYCSCQVVAGSHLDSSYQNHVYLNFSTPDVTKKYVVYGFITNKGNGYYIPGYVIEING